MDEKIPPVLSSITTFEEFDHLKLQIETLEKLAKIIIQKHSLPELPLTLFPEGTNIVFAQGEQRVIKIFPPMHQEQFNSELLVLQHLDGKLSIPTPSVEAYGTLSDWPYIVMTQLDGTLLETLWEKLDHHNKLVIIRELGALIHEVHALPTDGLEDIDSHWSTFITRQIEQCIEQHRTKNLPQPLIEHIPSYLEPIKHALTDIKKPVLLTGEYTPMNFLVTQQGGLWHIAGLIDFGDCMLGRPEYDLLGPGAFLIQGDKTLLKNFLLAYGYSENMLTNTFSHQMTALMLLHQYSNLNAQIRIKDWQNTVHDLNDLEKLVWGFEE